MNNQFRFETKTLNQNTSLFFLQNIPPGNRQTSCGLAKQVLSVLFQLNVAWRLDNSGFELLENKILTIYLYSKEYTPPLHLSNSYIDNCRDIEDEFLQFPRFTSDSASSRSD